MYIHDLRVSGIKLLRDLHLDFTRDGQPRMWTVLLGENGTCKTTVLQCIGLAAAGASKANQLLGSSSSFRALGRRSGGEIAANFYLPPDSQRLIPLLDSTQRPSAVTIHSMLRIEEGWNELKGTASFRGDALLGVHTAGSLSIPNGDPLVEIRGRALPRYFTVGYGVSRSLPFPNSTKEPTDVTTDRMRSLFDAEWRLIATDFIGKFPQKQARAFAATLKEVLVASGLLPNISDLRLQGRGGVTRPEDLVEAHRFVESGGSSVPATWLSHGYRSMIAWVADLVGQLFLDDPEDNPDREPSEFSGLVLVDELDLHLHPSWQRRLVSTLKKVFPKLQFIATTHSPIVLAGLEADEIIRLKRAPDGGVLAETNTTNPAFLTPTELLNEFFGFGDEFPSEVGQQMHEYMVLATNPFRDDEEEQQLDALRAELTAKNATPAIQPTPRKAANEQS
ncbi:MAG: AAA family ATPase [Archangium sp.]|nr:AAA family ATPase [Archangium sp.]